MSTIAQLRAGIKAVVQRASGHAHVQWLNQRQEQPTGACVYLSTRSMVTVGTPEERLRDGTPDAEPADQDDFLLLSDVVEQKQFTLVVKVEQFDQTLTALELANKIGARFYRPFALDALRAVNCAVRGIEATQEIDSKADKRMVSVAVFNVLLNWACEDTQEGFDAELVSPEVTDANNWIQYVEIVGPPDTVVDLSPEP